MYTGNSALEKFPRTHKVKTNKPEPRVPPPGPWEAPNRQERPPKDKKLVKFDKKRKKKGCETRNLNCSSVPTKKVGRIFLEGFSWKEKAGRNFLEEFKGRKKMEFWKIND